LLHAILQFDWSQEVVDLSAQESFFKAISAAIFNQNLEQLLNVLDQVISSWYSFLNNRGPCGLQE
jgi:hypothetical protein